MMLLLQERQFVSHEIIKQQQATLNGVLLCLDRQEKGKGDISAVQEVERDYGCKVYSIITMSDLITYLSEQEGMQEHLAAMKATANNTESSKASPNDGGVSSINNRLL